MDYKFFNKGLLALTIVFSIFYSVFLFSQNGVSEDQNKYEYRFDYGQIEKTPTNPNKKSFEETLYHVSLDTFEDGGNWYVDFPYDYGKAILATKEGAPKEVQENAPTPNNTVAENANNPADYFYSKPDTKSRVLGAKVTFYPMRRISPWIKIYSLQPIYLTGVVKGFEVFVSGRNIPHELFIVVEDPHGKEYEISMGKLNFQGWRKLSAQVPFTINQYNPKYPYRRGIAVKGFKIKFNMMESIGNYFIYFDNLSAEISRFVEENLLTDDIKDTW